MLVLRIFSWAPTGRFRKEHEPVGDIDTAVMDGLKALDLERPIRERGYCQIFIDRVFVWHSLARPPGRAMAAYAEGRI